MKHLNKYNFVCEFKLRLDDKLNSNTLYFLNNLEEMDSIDSGEMIVGQCDIQGQDILTGRYCLKSDIIADSESEYIETMRKDLILLIKRNLKYEMEGTPEVVEMTITDALIMAELHLCHKTQEGDSVYHSERKNLYYAVKADNYCEGSFDTIEDAIQSLEY